MSLTSLEQLFGIEIIPLLEKIVQVSRQNLKFLITMRGSPGCGKTTGAMLICEYLTEHEVTNRMVAADDFMVSESNDYTYDSTRNSEVHAKCISQCIIDKSSVIIQHNTNVRTSEATKTLSYMGSEIIPIFLETKFAWMAPESRPEGMQSVHNVPIATVHRMNTDHQIVSGVYFEFKFKKGDILSHPVFMRFISENREPLSQIKTKFHLTTQYNGKKVAYLDPCVELTMQTLRVTKLVKCPAGLVAIIDEPAFYQNSNKAHITLVVNAGFKPADLGTAATKFFKFDEFTPKDIEFTFEDVDIELDGIHCSNYTSSKEVSPLVTAQFESETERDIILAMILIPEVEVVQMTISGLCMYTISTKNVINKFLLKHLPKSLCYVITESNEAIRVLNGFPNIELGQSQIGTAVTFLEHVSGQTYMISIVEIGRVLWLFVGNNSIKSFS